MISPRSAKRKPLPAASSRTTLARTTSPPLAWSAIRAAWMTEAPKRSSSSAMGSPALRPTRTRRGSSVDSLRAAKARWVAMAQARGRLGGGQAQGLVRRLVAGGEGPLDGDGAVQGAAGGGEAGHEAVAHGLHLGAAVGG